MILNYCKLALRNLTKNRFFTIINITGLTIGMAATLLIFLWVYSERSWNKEHVNYDRISHVHVNRNFNGEINTGSDMMFPLAAAAMTAIPEVEKASISGFPTSIMLTVGDKKINRLVVTTSPEFLDIFSFEFLQGQPEGLQDPDGIILTESTANSLFNRINVVGEAVKINNDRTAYVKAVIKDPASTSTVQFDVLQAFNTSSQWVKNAQTDWVNCGNRVFFLLREGADKAAVEAKTIALIREKTGAENPTTRGQIILHPMSKWRLYEEFRDGINTGGRIQYVRLFTWIAIIILLIACVNFMNLSTARSEKRAREVGIRKTLGSMRRQLVFQFIAESVLLALFAFLISVLVVWITLPSFSKLLNQPIQLPFKEPFWWFIGMGIILLTGVIAGSYPALFLSGFKPVKVLKGTFLTGKSGLTPRKILVTAQFSISILLISATLLIYQQINHVQQRDLGYHQENLLMVNSSAQLDRQLKAVKNELYATGMVESVNRTSNQITDLFGYTSGIRYSGAPQADNLVIGFMFTDEDFAKTLQAKVIEGRDFLARDTQQILLNKAAVKVLGMKDPVGKIVTWAGRERTVVGVIDNMVINSPYAAPEPIMLIQGAAWAGRINIRFKNGIDIKKAVEAVEHIHRKFSPDYLFEYRFIDDFFNEKFNNEKLVGQLAIIFSGMAIFVCCLGLFGLVSFAIERRKKEIGIRKVLGASVKQLLVLLSQEFVLLIAFAFLIAIPLAWWMMHGWLANYAYRITINPLIFLVVAASVALIAFITISLNASRAALKNPATSLRSE
ncbi:ABC transporter permease [Flavihumibacter sp. UBA7668]|uniref:ABC transporter permease n=1 Tax=Flavihumibacter sp. UBA7668 TaxID=1946542 RepID=UPI0025C1A4AF|nr:ABC transporter permease [Flavihumibacter sp. UBA7668]